LSLIYKLKNILKPTDSLSPVENKINYLFHNRGYLVQAFTHKSISALPRRNYERLEFLGDAVIDIIISRELMREFPEGDEGFLTQRRASLVRKSFLAKISKMLDLLDHIKIESSVNMSIEKIAEKQQANLYEAIIGAIYLDGGIEPCRNLILDTIWAHRTEAWKETNYKGKLIEYCHIKDIGSPTFNVKDITGPDHQKTFEIEVKIDDQSFPTGMGLDKKSAEQTAAQIALEQLGAPF
jgi:ribonuclease-3|tara:strand:+ start:4651 stop:5364 length:714 start_codon:yes stop_codon:yes gene_type:complete